MDRLTQVAAEKSAEVKQILAAEKLRHVTFGQRITVQKQGPVQA